MADEMTIQEAAAVLCLLMVGVDGEIRQEELASMLENPFFKSHVGDKLGPGKQFLKQYMAAKEQMGAEALETHALDQLKTTYPAFKTKTLALMTLIAGADNEYHQKEKEFMARAATVLGIPVQDVQHELSRMQDDSIDREVTREAENETDGEEAQSDTDAPKE